MSEYSTMAPSVKKVRKSDDSIVSTLDENVNADKVVDAGSLLAVISKVTAVTIGPSSANSVRLLGLTITAALTGTCVITGFSDSDGTAQSITLAAATTAGFKDFMGALNSAGPLTITCSNAADDNKVIVYYRLN